MVQRRYKPEGIIGKLQEAEVLLSRGASVEDVCGKIAVTRQPYYRWRQEYGGRFRPLPLWAPASLAFVVL